jgi:hypothetical protein
MIFFFEIHLLFVVILRNFVVRVIQMRQINHQVLNCRNQLEHQQVIMDSKNRNLI